MKIVALTILAVVLLLSSGCEFPSVRIARNNTAWMERAYRQNPSEDSLRRLKSAMIKEQAARQRIRDTFAVLGGSGGGGFSEASKRFAYAPSVGELMLRNPAPTCAPTYTPPALPAGPSFRELQIQSETLRYLRNANRNSRLSGYGIPRMATSPKPWWR